MKRNDIDLTTPENRRKIGEKLRELRDEKGWGLQYLSEATRSEETMPVSVRHIQRAEGGEASVSSGCLRRIAKGLGRKLEDVCLEVFDETAKPPTDGDGVDEEEPATDLDAPRVSGNERKWIAALRGKRKISVVGTAVLLAVISVVFLSGQLRTPSDAEPNPSTSAKETFLTAGSPDERDAVKEALRANFLYELEIYKAPDQFDATQLQNYWVPEEQGGTAIVYVKNAVKRLKANREYYGASAAYEELEFISIQISHDLDYAEVKTREVLYQQVFRLPQERVHTRQPYLSGSYAYTLRKLNGKWLLQTTGAPYRR